MLHSLTLVSCVLDVLLFVQSKKHDSLSYIEGEIFEMKSLFARKEADALARFERESAEKQQSLERAREELRALNLQLQQVTHQYQDAQNCVHQNEQELRVLIVELDKERRQRAQMKQQLQAMFPDL